MQKDQNFEKKQENLRYIFYMQKSHTFCHPVFIDFWNQRRGGGGICMNKKKHNALNLYMQKMIHISLRVYI